MLGNKQKPLQKSKKRKLFPYNFVNFYKNSIMLKQNKYIVLLSYLSATKCKETFILKYKS